MSNPGVPPWGCPWHGLVKDFSLALPNGTAMTFPQPSGSMDWQLGSTALIQHPIAPEIVRSTEEAAADAASGRQWWNKAILSGDSLFGRALNGWIYIDPAGACWWATTTISDEHVAGGVAAVTLKRFGVLGGKAEEYTYNVTVPDMGQATPALEGSSGSMRVSRYHTNKVGSAAVFEVSTQFPGDQYGYWIWRPCGWAELKLAGPGASCVATAVTVRTRSQTLGTASSSPLTRAEDHWYVEQKTEGGNRLTQTPTGELSYYRLVQHEAISGTESSGYAGYVVGMFYDSTGLHELTLSEQALTNYSSPPAVHSGPTDFEPNVPVTGTWSSTTNFDTTLTITFAADGAEICSYVQSATQSSSELGTITDGGDSNVYSWSVDYSPGGSRSGGGTLPFLYDGLGGLGGQYTELMAAASVPELVPRDMGGNANGYTWSFGTNEPQYLSFLVHRHANALFGLCHWVTGTTPTTTNYLPEVATFGGALTLPSLAGGLDPSSTPVYGSWCPVTNKAIRALEPVCYV